MIKVNTKDHKRCIKCGSGKVYIGAFYNEYILGSNFIEDDVVVYIECVKCGKRVEANTLAEAWSKWDNED